MTERTPINVIKKKRGDTYKCYKKKRGDTYKKQLSKICHLVINAANAFNNNF